MREYSVPATVRVGRRGEPRRRGLRQRRRSTGRRSPTAGATRRRVVRRSPPDEFAAEVTAVARGLIAAGVGRGRPRRRCCPAPATSGRCSTTRSSPSARHRADLRDVLGRADRLDPVRLRRGRDRRGVGQAPGARRRRWPTGCPSCERIWQIEPPAGAPGTPGAVARAHRARLGRARRRRARPPPGRARRRPRHADLHLGHHRPAQGLRADPPQHAAPRSSPSPRCSPSCSTRTARCCCSCRSRTCSAR